MLNIKGGVEHRRHTRQVTDISGRSRRCLFEYNNKTRIRIISGSKYNAHTGPLFTPLDFLTLENLLNLNALKFYYKYIKDTLPSYFYSFRIVT